VPPSAADDRPGDRVQFERSPRVEVFLHRCAQLAAGESDEPAAKLRRIERCALGESDQDRLLVTAKESRIPVRVRLDEANRRAKRRRCQREGRQEGELLPQQRRRVGSKRDLKTCRTQLRSDLVVARARREDDVREGRLLAHETGFDALRLHEDGRPEYVRVALAQERDMVGAVQKRNDHSLADPVGGRKLERLLELCRLGRYPHHVDLSVKDRRRRDPHLEIAEGDALDP
jgi:hypothetical protein